MSTNNSGETHERSDPFRLTRFTSAQQSVYDTALSELKAGRKRTHWMWYIFPQIAGLGSSETSRYYAIQSLEEAHAYLEHAVLGFRLRECAEAVWATDGRGISEIFGSPDDVKLRSSMTLFALADGPGSVFARVLEKYFSTGPDAETLRRLRPSGE